MRIELFSIGNFVIHGYGFMIALGCIAALSLARYRATKRGLDKDFVYDIFIFALISGFLGAKILYCIVNIKEFIQSPLNCLGSSGFVVYGGIILGFLTCFLLVKKKKYNFLDYFDLTMPSISIAQGFGRIGCFLAGCCYGRETDAWYGVTFPENSLAPAGISLIPTQLISSAGDFLIAITLCVIAKKTTKKGIVGLSYIILYSIGRFFVEFLRNDHRGEIGFLSTSQFISLIIFFITIGILIFIAKKNNKKEMK